MHSERLQKQFFRRLRAGIVITIALKLVLLSLLYLFFFSSSQRPHIDASAVEQRLLPFR